MEQSKVYFSDLRAPVGTNLLRKLEKLIRRAGIGDIDMEKKLVAIKLHFGEPGNLTYLRPNYAKVVADVVKSLGGVPFLTDWLTDWLKVLLIEGIMGNLTGLFDTVRGFKLSLYQVKEVSV